MATNEQLLGTDAPLSAFVKLETQTASNSASLDFTTGFDNSKYIAYLFVFDKLLPATDGQWITVRVSTDGGSTWDTTASSYVYQRLYGISGTATSASGSSTYWSLTGGDGNVNDYEQGHSGELKIWDLGDASRTQITGQYGGYSSAGASTVWHIWGQRTEDQAENGVQVLYSSGNISSGTVTLFGIPK